MTFGSTNLLGTIRTVYAFAPHLAARGDAAILYDKVFAMLPVR